MKQIVWRVVLFWVGLAVCGAMGGGLAACQTKVAKVERGTFSALLLSDLHFDPFHDPGIARQLVDAPVKEWNGILAGPASTDQAVAFAKLQQQCGARGVDTPYALLHSSLRAARVEGPSVRFITVSGDLIAHGFDCRYAAVIRGKTQADYTAFVEKTVEYVTSELRGTFPGVPVYVALGNNDSDCGDYRLDGGSDFLKSAGKNVIAGLPKSANQKEALADFVAGGYYSVMMAAPMQNTRLIVLDDIFMSPKYTTCGGTQNTAVASAQIEWLRKQLAEAKRQQQRVWVMGHIPPGVDVYSTFAKMRNVCGGDAPLTFLASDELGDVLVKNADTVRLGIFAHTHMDELMLLGPANGTKVAIKVVSSISPVDGNNPSFTVARVDAASATMVDYEVFAASNQTGVATSWSKEYVYSQTYHEDAFSSVALEKLIDEFHNDPDAKTTDSKGYIKTFSWGTAPL